MRGARTLRDLTIALVLAGIALFLLALGRSFDAAPTPRGAPAPDVEEEILPDALLATGISGVVTVGPQCPTVRAGEPCPDAPFAGVVDIVVDDPERELIARVRTDSSGRFAATVPSGSYAVVVQTHGTFPLCPEIPVTVTEGAVASLTVSCDSGIR